MLDFLIEQCLARPPPGDAENGRHGARPRCLDQSGLASFRRDRYRGAEEDFFEAVRGDAHQSARIDRDELTEEFVELVVDRCDVARRDRRDVRPAELMHVLGQRRIDEREQAEPCDSRTPGSHVAGSLRTKSSTHPSARPGVASICCRAVRISGISGSGPSRCVSARLPFFRHRTPPSSTIRNVFSIAKVTLCDL